jgi:hypothetical protein
MFGKATGKEQIAYNHQHSSISCRLNYENNFKEISSKAACHGLKQSLDDVRILAHWHLNCMHQQRIMTSNIFVNEINSKLRRVQNNDNNMSTI